MSMLENYNDLKKKEEGYDAVVAKFGSIENALNAIAEEDVLKFYYCESEDKYLVGQRVDTLYYAEVKKTGLCFRMSRYLPWGEHVVAPNTVWKEYTYPSEPKEIPFFEWLQGYIAKMKQPTVDAVHVVRCKDCTQWGCGLPMETDSIKCCGFGGYMVGKQGYCVYGQKKHEQE